MNMFFCAIYMQHIYVVFMYALAVLNLLTWKFVIAFQLHDRFHRTECVFFSQINPIGSDNCVSYNLMCVCVCVARFHIHPPTLLMRRSNKECTTHTRSLRTRSDCTMHIRHSDAAQHNACSMFCLHTDTLSLSLSAYHNCLQLISCLVCVLMSLCRRCRCRAVSVLLCRVTHKMQCVKIHLVLLRWTVNPLCPNRVNSCFPNISSSSNSNGSGAQCLILIERCRA